ncbi:MAG: UDP-N-acetylmuramoyl-L-alanine--D-glutamate ligase [Clostridia bacterium]|nr:UDP-N-acetylmuramoyl-L-alanine--D-glutamate ligase [Clostridia bacterium]
MEWQGKKVLVIGLGKSGLAAARELIRRGAAVIACDQRVMPRHKVADLRRAGAKLVLGSYPQLAAIRPQLVIVSPGVPLGEQPLVEAREMNIPIWGELELAYRLLPSGIELAAITGTNGKTTTTALFGQILKDAGFATLIGGNIGVPLVKEVRAAAPGSYIVCEVSSFQLETINSFHPRVAVIINITPDHLDRHGDLASYAAAKQRLMAYQGPGDFAILNYDDPLTRSMAAHTRARVLFFSCRQRLEKGAYLAEGYLCLNPGTAEIKLCRREELSLKGSHNLENCLAASLGAFVMGVPPAQIVATLKSFPGLPHRLETVAEINGVLYINDSKGTNPEATIKALEAYNSPLVLIAGGRKKGNDFTELAARLPGRVKYLILLGEAAAEIEQAARRAGLDSIYRAPDLEAAVYEAARVASAGDVVMLSPACTSWDMFKSYEERGNFFKRYVFELANKRQAVGG